MKWAWLVAALSFLVSCTHNRQQMLDKPMWNTLNGEAPLIIAHRGASGYLPEHTLEAYALAIDLGADIIEPDLVFTKDGILVARHDRYLSTTTNVADHPEFSGRKHLDAFEHGDGARARIDWWIEDFTLEELKTLRARQPFPGRSKEFDDQYKIPTFDEILNLVTRGAKDANRSVGIYPETKSPGYFESIGHDFEKPLLAALEGFNAGPVFIQSFEPEILKRLKGKTNAKLVQLVDEETPGAGPNIPLTEIAEYADGVGPSKDLFWDLQSEFLVSNIINDAHNLGLFVHPWTFRNDQPNAYILDFARKSFLNRPPPSKTYLASEIRITKEEAGTPLFEYESYFRFGVDGVFTDFPDTAYSVVNSGSLVRSLTKK